MSRIPLILMSLLLAAVVAFLTACTDIPDESPEAVRVSMEISNPQTSGNRGPSRSASKTDFGLEAGNVGTAYLIEQSAYEANLLAVDEWSQLPNTADKPAQPVVEPYSSGTYTWKSGSIEGSVSLDVPLNTEVFLVVYFDTDGTNLSYFQSTDESWIGDFWTQKFTYSGSGDISVAIDSEHVVSASGGNNDTTRPSSIKAFAIDNLTTKDGTATSILEILQWEDNPIHGFSILYEGLMQGQGFLSSPTLSASCKASDDIYLQNSDNSSCINITQSWVNYGYQLLSLRTGFTYIDLFRVEELTPTETYYISFKRGIIGDNGSHGDFSGSDNGTHFTFEINLNNLSSVTDQASNNYYYLWTDEWVTAP
jgi:hypothetical protein